VNTHLEIQPFAPIQHLQTAELLTEVVYGLEGVTVMTGDFNSDAAAGPGAPSWTESYDMIRTAGFADAWLEAEPAPGVSGVTCCQASDLRNDASQLYQRIDFVFIRLPRGKGPGHHIPGRIDVDVVGDEVADKVGLNNLWPSDHAGVVADFWLPPGLTR
jgi:hypothetical protein